MSASRPPHVTAPGPFRVEHLRDGDRYELSDGHPLYCAPAGPKHGRPHVVGALPLASDPAVTDIGIDVGHALGERTLRAPDLSVGDLGEGEGTWSTKAPPLAVEYAAQGQDEAELRAKIDELLAAGTELVWVVRLTGPRRVEVHAKGRPMRTFGPGDRLEAPGILKNPVPAEVLYDREAAFEHTLQNLLERHGYPSLDDVRAEGEARGRAEGEARGRVEGEAHGRAEGEAAGEARGRAEALLAVLEARALPVTAAERARITGCTNLAELERWVRRAVTARATAELFERDDEP
jgi:Uma2 family endonuclease